MELIQEVNEFVRELSEGEGTGHDYYHALRVWRNAKEIAKDFDVDMEVIEISALIHDLIDEKVELISKDELIKKLRDFGVEDKKIQQVMDVVEKISFSKNIPKDELSLEAKIVQDADRLDALGAIGIARVFTYSGKTGRPIHDPRIKPILDKRIRSKTAINHFYEKLFRLKDEMNTQKAKRMAKAREEIMKSFLEQFYAEWEGRK